MNTLMAPKLAPKMMPEVLTSYTTSIEIENQETCNGYTLRTFATSRKIFRMCQHKFLLVLFEDH